ncbi:hypothetical protein [Oceanirhabdus seepicola]|uniref:DUF4340 domain-containing protein n=1 Tax=Oceanirhabdus seepicola TaxID=2828781 RepID=A0A9J6NYX9_9CLOT|nr:hypothetical protein [Oceanirhabdus seepicola]MCM1989182.1 hypothetical protein [Oceanirhabdus seepicola]
MPKAYENNNREELKMLKRFKKIKVFVIMIVIFILCCVSIQPIDDFIQRKSKMKYNNIILDVINKKLGNINFKVKGEEGSYSVEFKDIEFISDYNQIIKFMKGEVKVSYVFKYSELLTESDPFELVIPIIRDNRNDEFSIEDYNKSEQVEITTKILEGFLGYKFEQFHNKSKKDDSIGKKEIVSEMVYDYTDMKYDRFGMIIDGSKIGFHAKQRNSLCGMTFSGEYNKYLNGEEDSIDIEIKEYTGQLRPLWSVDYENVEDVKVFENGKYERAIVDKGMIQRIFTLINEFKYEQINSSKMQKLIEDNHYSLIFNDGMFDYYVVVGRKGIVIINDQSAASEEASHDLEFFLKMEI